MTTNVSTFPQLTVTSLWSSRVRSVLGMAVTVQKRPSVVEGQGITHETPVYFLCRSGVRSVAAATEATAAGWTRAYNIIDGFEGKFDAQGRRLVSGWKVAGLPWRQD